jgi:hypothetical protein
MACLRLQLCPNFVVPFGAGPGKRAVAAALSRLLCAESRAGDKPCENALVLLSREKLRSREKKNRRRRDSFIAFRPPSRAMSRIGVEP